MNKNIKQIINPRKIKVDCGDNHFNGDKVLQEQTSYSNDDATTLVGGNIEEPNIFKQRKVTRNQDEKKNINLSDGEEEPEELFESKVKAFNDELYKSSHDAKEKYKLLDKFNKYRKKGYQDIQNLTIDDDIKLFRAVHDNLRYVIKKDRAIKTLKHLLWIFTWLFELFISKMGYGARFTGFSRYLWKHIDNFEEHFEDMVSDKFVVDEKTNTVKRIENTSVVAKLDVNPMVNLAFAWVREAIQFSAINHAAMFTSTFKSDKDQESELNDEEYVFGNTPVPEPDE